MRQSGIFKGLSAFLIITFAAHAQAPVVLKEGEEVSLKFAQSVSSKTAVTDDTVEFVLAEDLKAGDVVVAKATDVQGDNIRVVTMYSPDPSEWQMDGRIRGTAG